MKKVIIYARQSSGSESHSDSIEVQIQNAMTLARRMKLEVTDIFFDYNISGKTYPTGYEFLAEHDKIFINWYSGQSGSKKYRDGLGKLFLLLPDIDYIIVDEITRLYRPLSNSFLEALVNQNLIANGVQIIQVKGGIIDFTLFDQHFVTTLKNRINDEQIAKQRQKSIEVMQKIRDDGYLPTGPKAWGLEYDSKTKVISMTADKAQLVRMIFDGIENGTSYSEIIRIVNIKYSVFFKSCFWNKNFYNIAKNPIYCGMQWNSYGKLIKNKQWNGIISLEQFENVQQILQKKRDIKNKKFRIAGEHKHFLPLSGSVYCGNCGSRLIAGFDRGNIFYYCRRGALAQKKECAASRIRESLKDTSVAGLKDSVYSFFRLFFANTNFFEESASHFEHETFILKNYDINSYISGLYKNYKSKKLTENEYCFLFRNTFDCIIVYADKVVFETKFGRFERRRKTVKRQKGIVRR